MAKVMYGVSKLHVGEYNVATNGTVTLGTPYELPGTVRIAMNPSSNLETFYADNIAYWSGYSDDGYEGEIENALFDDTFKTRFLNYQNVTGGGIAQVKGKKTPNVYFMFQAETDADSRRAIVYNASFGMIQREYETTEDSTTPATATLPFKVNGDAGTGIVKAVYPKSASVYTTMFTSPPVPTLTT